MYRGELEGGGWGGGKDMLSIRMFDKRLFVYNGNCACACVCVCVCFIGGYS